MLKVGKSYTPFGWNMPGRQVNTDEYRHGFNGMEKNPEIAGGNYDFGARMYDSRVGRWWSVDKFATMYAHSSPYVFALNNPNIVIDVGGDSVWIELGQYSYNSTRGVLEKTTHIHLKIKVLDVSNREMSSTEKKELLNSIRSNLNSKLSTSVKRGTGKYKNEQVTQIEDIVFHTYIEEVTNMSKVNSSDHLLVLVDDVVIEAVTKDGKTIGAAGVANLRGKVAYVETYPSYFSTVEIDAIATNAIHEIGHLLGLSHSWEDGFNDTNTGKNYLDYTHPSSSEGQFSKLQIYQIYAELIEGVLNQGSNSEIQLEDSSIGIFGGSSEEEPWSDSVKKGDRVPHKIKGGDKCCQKPQ